MTPEVITPDNDAKMTNLYTASILSQRRPLFGLRKHSLMRSVNDVMDGESGQSCQSILVTITQATSCNQK